MTSRIPAKIEHAKIGFQKYVLYMCLMFRLPLAAWNEIAW